MTTSIQIRDTVASTLPSTQSLVSSWPYQVLAKHGLDFSEDLKICDQRINSSMGQAPEAAAMLKLACGGKRMRPLMMLLGCAAVTKDTGLVGMAAASLEMLHMASLIHDDVLDGASLRRGSATLHTTLGVGVAITLGDYLMLAAGATMLGECGDLDQVELSRLMQAHAILLKKGQECCRGQVSELQAQAGMTVEECIEMMRNKTGSLFSAACEMGAVLGGADQAQRQAAAAYGNAFGLAFQIYDDLLDLLSSSGDAHKSTGETCTLGRPLLPAILLSPKRKTELCHMLADGHQSGDVLALLHEEGVVAAIMAQLEWAIQGALHALEALPATAARAVFKDYVLHARFACQVLCKVPRRHSVS